jgi:ribonuclease HI
VITIYSDGGCSPNPGKGAWAFVAINHNNEEVLRSACIGESTNSICELTAAIEALKYVTGIGESNVTFYLDSDYVRRGITEWIPTWINPGAGRRPWTTSNGKPVKNQELWKELHALNANLKVIWTWVKAHNGDHYNEMVDGEVVRARNYSN